MSTSIFSSTKLLLISAAVFSLAIVIKLSVPIAVDELPAVWSVTSSWLKPPYLYILINVIIVTILASSKFHHQQPSSPVRSEHLISVKTPPPSDFDLLSAQILKSSSEDRVVYDESDEEDRRVVEEAEEDRRVVEEAVKLPVVVNGAQVDNYDATQEIISHEAELDFVLPVREKPLVSSRFGHRKTMSRTTPEGVRSLRVSKSKRHETLDSTWKMITEGRHVPLTRHMKKSETFDHQTHHVTVNPPDQVSKSKMFNQGTNYGSPASTRIRKEPSTSHDELNRRVEAFIKKFNDDMRMQRQESMNQYAEMFKRGV